jgi:hypothetical protein
MMRSAVTATSMSQSAIFFAASAAGASCC